MSKCLWVIYIYLYLWMGVYKMIQIYIQFNQVTSTCKLTVFLGIDLHASAAMVIDHISFNFRLSLWKGICTVCNVWRLYS